MIDRTELAKENFLKGYNCAQAVFVAFADVVGLTEEEAAAISSPFGGGFGRMREVCGAVSGMTLVLGYLEGNSDPKNQEAKTRIYERERELINLFIQEKKTIVCREILELAKGEKEASAPSVRTKEFYESRPCLGCVELAARIAEEQLIK